MAQEMVTPPLGWGTSDFARCLHQARATLDAAVEAMERGDAAALDDVLAARLLVSTLIVLLESA